MTTPTYLPTSYFECDNCGDRNVCDKTWCFHHTTMPNKMIALRDAEIRAEAKSEAEKHISDVINELERRKVTMGEYAGIYQLVDAGYVISLLLGEKK